MVRASGDAMQVPLPRAKGNRDINHIGMARPAAQHAGSSSDRVVQVGYLRARVAEQHGYPRLTRSAAPRLRNGTCGCRLDFAVQPGPPGAITGIGTPPGITR
jgi:hypothetical protein